jgi:glycosyltransferase involved in cell wall biosynthesis
MSVLLTQNEVETAPASAVAGESPFTRAHDARAQTVASLTSVPTSERTLRILWIADVDYRLGVAQGSNLRLINFAREVRAQGHAAYFAVPKRNGDDAVEKQKFLERLKTENVITDHFSIEYRHPKAKGKLAHIAFYPGAANLLLRSAQQSLADELDRMVAANAIDVCIFMSRDLLFALPSLKSTTTIVDWIDSYFLYHLREARFHVKRARPLKVLRSLQLAAESWIHERYYSRRADLSLAVSPVDQRYISRQSNSHVVANGVASLPSVSSPKVKGQLIFTGNMDFPPNYQSALWFIDEVFPLLRARSNVHLVIAGANPIGELLARADEQIHITGYIEDMRKEIAQSELYVAPLITGGGFKNKVVEAIASGTFVIGTSFATEFLPAEARACIPTADSADQLAKAIVNYLDGPERHAPKLEKLRRIVTEEFSWNLSARKFVDIIRPKAFADSRS